MSCGKIFLFNDIKALPINTALLVLVSVSAISITVIVLVFACAFEKAKFWSNNTDVQR